MQPTDARGTNDDSAPVRVGDVLAAKYRVEQVLGVGGMGVVVRAHHLYLDERVAIKFIRSEALSIPEVVARFVREARAAVKIRNEHVARVIDVGTLETGAPYMVMEFLEGVDLSTLKHAGGTLLPVPTAVDYVLQALEAIAEAHALGIIHRDLKPANLFLTHRADGSPIIKVLDFGISKVTSISGSSTPELGLTKTSATMGSPLYMSPEQMVSSRDVDVRTDIWAVGVILYELLSGQPPFSGETLPQLCAAILQQQPRAIAEMRSDLPPGLEAIVQRCLDKSPQNRFANVGDLALALAPFALPTSSVSITRITGLFQHTGQSTGAQLPPLQPANIQPTGVTNAPAALNTSVSWEQTASRTRSWKLPAIAAGAVGGLLLLAAVAGYLFGPWRDDSAAPAASAAIAAEVSAVPPVESVPLDVSPPIVEASAPPPASTAPPAATAAPPRTTTTRPPRTQPTTTRTPPPATTTSPPKKKTPTVSDFGDRK